MNYMLGVILQMMMTEVLELLLECHLKLQSWYINAVETKTQTTMGDCPGLNAVIRAVVRRGEQHGFEFVGIRDGWRGLVENNHFRLTRQSISGILHLGGTILGPATVSPSSSHGPG